MDMPKFLKKTVQVTIANKHTIAVDASDADRVAIHAWTPVENGKRVTFMTEVGRSRNGVEYQLLASFVLEQKPSVFVEQRDASKPMDYSRNNLRIYHAPHAQAVLRAN